MTRFLGLLFAPVRMDYTLVSRRKFSSREEFLSHTSSHEYYGSCVTAHAKLRNCVYAIATENLPCLRALLVRDREVSLNLLCQQLFVFISI